MSSPRIFRLCQNKLLDFLKLMDSKNTPSIFSMSSCFFSETSRSSCILNWQRFFFNPFTSMKSRNRLLRCCNQEIIIISLFRTFSFNFIKIFVKITKLTSFSHNFSFHKERGLNGSKVSLVQKVNTIVNKSII